MNNILLLEANYKNTYPPLGLMKISSYHKDLGDKVFFSKGKLKSKILKKKDWDRIYITTLFTFEWEKTVNIINYAKELVYNNINKIYVGGIAATLMPDDLEEETGIKPIMRKLDKDNHIAKEIIGYDNEHVIEDYTPDYDILNQIDYSYPCEDAYFAYMTRGCGMNCEFCAVDTLEPEYEPYISVKEQIKKIDEKFGSKKDLLLMDNNVLISPCFEKIVEEIIDIGYGKECLYDNNKASRDGFVDFNQGLDANILAKNESKAELLGKLSLKPARIAFDHIEDENTYRKAVINCAKYGVEYFSNYLLYNADSFKGKGKQYDADEPGDLYKRIKITLELQDKINKEINSNARIYSFPMKFIPLKRKNRKYISTPNWNEKYLRAIQVMLLPLKGIGGVSEEFFRKAFGENLDEFKRNIKMPEQILMSRGKFLRKDIETKEEHKLRINSNDDVFRKYKFYNEWIRLYSKIKSKNVEEDFIENIKGNSFNYNNYLELENELIKRIYLHYLSPNKFLNLISYININNMKKEIEVIFEYTYNEFKYYYEKMIKYFCSKRSSTKKLIGFLNIYGTKIASEDIILEWYKVNRENEDILEQLKMAMYYIGEKPHNIDKFRAIKRYIDIGCLNDQKLAEVDQYVEEFNEDKITEILVDNFGNFKEHLKHNNFGELHYDEIERRIVFLSAKLGEQLSLF